MQKYTVDALLPTEIDALLALQKANLKQSLDAQTIDSQGFVSFVYTPEIIARMMADAPQIIARADDGTLVGYALVASLGACRTIDNMLPLLEVFENVKFGDKYINDCQYYVMGQVCVRDGWRGIGVFDALYAGHKRFLGEKFDFVVTEIAPENGRSLAAHRRVGFQTIHTYYDDVSQKEWQVVAWDWR